MKCLKNADWLDPAPHEVEEAEPSENPGPAVMETELEMQYIGQLAAALSRIAHRKNYGFLGYLLEMSALEAHSEGMKFDSPSSRAR